MKTRIKILTAIIMVILLSSCEHKSGKRDTTHRYYTIEYANTDSTKVLKVFNTRESAKEFQAHLDSSLVWNKLSYAMSAEQLIDKGLVNLESNN